MAGANSITLHSGRLFDFERPEANEITLEDIAHGLSHVCRYAGHCSDFYSVAEHSVLVSLVARKSPLAALLHDAAEAFLGDVASPLKRLLPDYRALEKRVEQAVFSRFGLGWPMPEEVKHADQSVMSAELQVLMPAGTNDWLREAGVTPASVEIRRLDPVRAKALFLTRYDELTACGSARLLDEEPRLKRIVPPKLEDAPVGYTIPGVERVPDGTIFVGPRKRLETDKDGYLVFVPCPED